MVAYVFWTICYAIFSIPFCKNDTLCQCFSKMMVHGSDRCYGTPHYSISRWHGPFGSNPYSNTSLADDAIYRVVCEIYCDENFLFLLKKCQFISIRKSCNPAIMTLTLHPQSINECIVMQWHGAHSSTEIFNLVSFSGSLQQNNN